MTRFFKKLMTKGNKACLALVTVASIFSGVAVASIMLIAGMVA